MDAFVAFTKEAFTLLGVAVSIVVLRTVWRWRSVGGLRNLKADDYLMWFALVVYGLETGLAYLVGARFGGFANNGMTPEERESLDPDSEEFALRVGGCKIQLIGWNVYTLLLWTLKMCMCIFYSRLTQGLEHMALRIRIGYIFIVITYLAVMLSINLGCMPFSENWQINPDPGNRCQPAVSRINLYVTVVLNVLTDIYLLSIPLPLLWKASMPKRRKGLLIILFSGGVFVMLAGILRCALIIANPISGAQQAGFWAVRETFVAIFIGNLPMVFPLFRRALITIGLYIPPITISIGSRKREYKIFGSSNASRDHRKYGHRRKVEGGIPLVDQEQQHQRTGSGGRAKGMKRTAHPISTLGSIFESGTVNVVVTGGGGVGIDDAGRGTVMSQDTNIHGGRRSSNDSSSKMEGPGIKVSTRVTSSESTECVADSVHRPVQYRQGQGQGQVQGQDQA